MLDLSKMVELKSALDTWNALNIGNPRHAAIKNDVWGKMGAASLGTLKCLENNPGINSDILLASLASAFCESLTEACKEVSRPMGAQ